MSTLLWKNKARKTQLTTYLRIAGARKLKEDAKDKSKTDRVTRKADKIEQSSEQTLKNVDEETDRDVFRNLAKRRKLEVFDQEELALTMDDIVAIRNFCGLSTAKFLKLKKAIEILRPALKNVVFLANLKKRFTEFEKEGNLPI